MNPYKLSQVYKQLTSQNSILKKYLKLGTKDIKQPDLPAFVETKNAVNRFMRDNPRPDQIDRKDMAGGGMLVQPSADGSRPGYAKSKKKLTSAQEFNPNKMVEATGSTIEEFNKATKHFTKGKKKWSELGGKENENLRKKIIRNIRANDGVFKEYVNIGGAGTNKVKNFTEAQKEKILRYFPNAKLAEHYYGVPPGDPDYEKIKEFVKRGFIIRAEFDPLPIETQNKIKEKFTLPKGENWDFNRLKYGYSSDTLLGKAISQFVNKPKPWKFAGVQLTTPEGWFIAQMNRAFENGITIDGRTLAYDAIKNKNGKIVGFVDNTEAGEGKRYVVNETYQGTNDVLLTDHKNFDTTKKWFNFAKNADLNPSKVITDILSKGGVNVQGLRTSTILNYLIEKTPSTAKLKRAIVMHHKGGIQNATSDFQILDRVINRKANDIEIKMRANPENIDPNDVKKLKKYGVTVKIGDQVYGSGPQTMEAGVKKIENLILKGSTNEELYGKKVKGIQDFTKKDFDDLNKYLAKIGCPGFQAADGGRATFDVGTNCQMKGANLINSGMKNASPAQLKNFATFANRAKALGRGVMKFGVIPEAMYVAADSAIRLTMGDKPIEALLRASEYLLPGDQTKLAEVMEATRLSSPETAAIIGRSIDYKNQLARIDSLTSQRDNLENLSGGGEFDYIGNLNQDVSNLNNQIKQATDALNTKFKMTDAEQIYADRMQAEVDDIRKSKSPLTKLKSMFRDVDPDSDVETIAAPEKTQEQLNKRLADQLPRDLLLATEEEMIRAAKNMQYQGYDIPDDYYIKEKLKTKNLIQNMSLAELAAATSPEQIYGASGTMGEPLNKGVVERPQNIIGDMEREITGQTNVANPFDIDLSMIGSGLRGFSAAGGGIAKQAGVDSGPPPESGPSPQGLSYLMKRGKNI